MELTCPKCQGAMRTYERNGVHVDQCGECRGIFLDRGELEKLVDAEAAFHSPAAQAPPVRPSSGSGGGGGLGAIVGEVMQQARSQQSGGSYGGHQQHGYPRKKKKESFLGELFG